MGGRYALSVDTVFFGFKSWGRDDVCFESLRKELLWV